MAEKARVHSIQALTDFRPALVKFQEEVSTALMSAEADAGRMVLRLRTQMQPYWKKQIRVRTDELQRAKSKLIAKQAAKPGESRSTVDERKAVEKAKRRVQEAEEKHEATRRWIRRLEKEQAKYSGGVQALKSFVAAEVPRGLAELDRMIRALEAYTQLAAPRAPVDEPGRGRAGKDDA